MNDHATQDPQALLDRLDAQSTRFETPCGDGRMVWRLWAAAGDTAPVVALFHGGAGSWRHWVHTIPALAPHYRVLVPDLPGLGESDFPPDGDNATPSPQSWPTASTPSSAPTHRYDVVGFSFGGTMAACVGALRGARIRSVTIIGSSGVGPLGSAIELLKVRHLQGDERRETHRENLNRLMIADRGKIDELALVIQDWNTVRSRLRTPSLSRSGAILRAIDRLQSPLNGIWGELDAPANPQAPKRVAALRERCPDADIRLIPGAGHWVAYEAPEPSTPCCWRCSTRA